MNDVSIKGGRVGSCPALPQLAYMKQQKAAHIIGTSDELRATIRPQAWDRTAGY